jgi:hypothetical protein
MDAKKNVSNVYRTLSLKATKVQPNGFNRVEYVLTHLGDAMKWWFGQELPLETNDSLASGLHFDDFGVNAKAEFPAETKARVDVTEKSSFPC